MARVTRMALDLTLVSLKKIQPAVSSMWGAAKAMVIKTPAKPLVCNIVVTKVESVLDKIVGMIVSGVTTLRNKQLPREEKYLARELDKVRQRMSAEETASKALRPGLGCAWQYLKVEAVPPMTGAFFQGSGGKKLESTVASTVDGFILGLQQRIKDIEQEEIRVQKEKEAAIKAAAEKAKAAAKAKEAERKKAEELKQKEVEKAAKAKADAKAKEEAKKAAEKPKEPPKAEKKKADKKTPPAKKAAPAKKAPPTKK